MTTTARTIEERLRKEIDRYMEDMPYSFAEDLECRIFIDERSYHTYLHEEHLFSQGRVLTFRGHRMYRIPTGETIIDVCVTLKQKPVAPSEMAPLLPQGYADGTNASDAAAYGMGIMERMNEVRPQIVWPEWLETVPTTNSEGVIRVRPENTIDE